MNAPPEMTKPDAAGNLPSGAPDGKCREDGVNITSTGGRRVLLVDDEKSILASLRRLLRREPYELVTANSAAEALEMMQDKPAQLVMTDQRMPGLTGIELLQEIRVRWPHTVRIILSGYSEVNTIITAINEGAIYKFVTKPWNDEEIKLHVRRALEQYELEAENRRLTQEVSDQNAKLRELNELLDQRAMDASTGLTFAQELLETIDAGVLTLDEDGLIVGANREARELICPSNCELIGIGARTALSSDMFESLFPEGTQCSGNASGQVLIDEHAVQWRARPIRDDERLRGQILTLWREVA